MILHGKVATGTAVNSVRASHGFGNFMLTLGTLIIVCLGRAIAGGSSESVVVCADSFIFVSI